VNLDYVQSAPGQDPIVVEGYFAASPATVYKAWTDPDIVVKWFGQAPNSLHSAEIDLRPGGAWRFLKSKDGAKSMGFEGTYLEIIADTRLVYSWALVQTHEDGSRDMSEYSQVEVNFKTKGKGTAVRLVHSAIREEDMRRGVGGGWNAAFTHIAALFPAS
jgi:uncharacterized protein YndB with AHSA1/START domain